MINNSTVFNIFTKYITTLYFEYYILAKVQMHDFWEYLKKKRNKSTFLLKISCL